MRVTKVTCEDCGFAHEGDFPTPRILRLSREEQKFVELFVSASGSLKEMSALLEVSYPTVRNRLDKLIERLAEEKQKDDKRKSQILEDIEKGKISAKQGMRMIDAL